MYAFNKFNRRKNYKKLAKLFEQDIGCNFLTLTLLTSLYHQLNKLAQTYQWQAQVLQSKC